MKHRESGHKNKDLDIDDISLQWQSCISHIFIGAIPESEEQLTELLRPHIETGQSFPAADIWAAFQEAIIYRDRPIAVNPHTERLANLAVDGYPEAPSLSALINKSTEVPYTVTKALTAFKQAFPAQMARLIMRIDRTRLPICAALISAYGQKLQKGQIRRMLPEELLDLLALVTAIGSELGDEYHLMVKRVRKTTSLPLIDFAYHPIIELLEKLPERYAAYTNDNMHKIININNHRVAKTLAECPKVSPKVLQKAIAHLARLTHELTMCLATPYELPKDLSGKQLCRVLMFLDKNIRNPAGMISGIPDPEDFAVRTLEMRFASDKKTTETLKDAAKARDSLALKANSNATIQGIFLGHLKKAVTMEREGLLFAAFRRSHHLTDKEMMTMLNCLLDLRRHWTRMAPYPFGKLKFNDIKWSDEPPEEEAFKIVKAIESIGKNR